MLWIDRIAELPLAQQQSRLAQAMLEKALTEALDQHGEEIEPNGKEATPVRAVRKDTVMFAFKAAYQAEHADANVTAVEQAWRRGRQTVVPSGNGSCVRVR
jgi:hypothetical protein